MHISIKATNLELTDAIRDYIEKKMDMAEKFLGSAQVISCDYEVELTTNHHQKGQIFRAEVHLALDHETIWVDETSDDLYKAIDLVKDKLIDLLKKHKEKHLAKRREGNKEE